jgi:hypothetical protein
MEFPLELMLILAQKGITAARYGNEQAAQRNINWT